MTERENKFLNFVNNRNVNPRKLKKSGLQLNEYGITQLGDDKTCLDNDFRREKLWRFKKGKIFLFIYINSSVVNTDRPIISKTNCLKENLNDANRSFENNEEFSSAFQLDQKHRLQ